MKIEHVTKTYGEKTVLTDFSLCAENKKITVILGESGSGKTTLLKVITGTTDFSGTVKDVDLPVSMLYQENRLIKNLTVEENLKLFVKNICVESALDFASLTGAGKLYPKDLSGGMARRVAMLRALFFPHKTLIMDEPFSSLDLKTKFSLIEKIKKRQKTSGETIIAVTHDVKEAVMLADRVIVLKNGKIVYDNDRINDDAEAELISVLTE